MTSLEKAILSTVAYYDVLEYPLTFFEVHRYLVNPARFGGDAREVSPEEVRRSLEESMELTNRIDAKNGFYFLKGREHFARMRMRMRKYNDAKRQKTLSIVRFFSLIPYVRIVFASGSLAVGNTTDASDLDLLVVVRTGRIWTARFLLTFFTHVAGVRRHGTRVKDRICLNHYITDANLVIPLRSLYNAHTYAHLIPLFISSGAENAYKGFADANRWMGDFLAHVKTVDYGAHTDARFGGTYTRRIQRIGEFVFDSFLGDIFESLLRQYQKARIEKKEMDKRAPGRVVADDFTLEFHPDSPERSILDKYNKNVLKLGYPELAIERDSGLS